MPLDLYEMAPLLVIRVKSSVFKISVFGKRSAQRSFTVAIGKIEIYRDR